MINVNLFKAFLIKSMHFWGKFSKERSMKLLFSEILLGENKFERVSPPSKFGAAL